MEGKRFLAVILCICMCLPGNIWRMPLQVCAADEQNNTSGTCGENATWTFDESTGTLTFDGEGAVDNRKEWQEFHDQIKIIYIGYGITSLDIKLHGSPNINTSLKNLEQFEVESGNNNFSTIDGVLFNNDKTELIYYPAARVGFYTIPDGTIKIGDKAFGNCRQLVAVNIPDSVEVIGKEAFYPCMNLADVQIGKGVRQIEMQAFSTCTSLSSIVIPENVESIGWRAFEDCGSVESLKGLQSVTILGKDTKMITKDGSDSSDGDVYYAETFAGCTGLKEVTLACNVGAFAFSDCKALTDVIITDGATQIGYAAFEGCNNIEYVQLPESLKKIGNDAFASDKITDFYIPANLEDMQGAAVRNCNNLTRFIIDEKNNNFVLKDDVLFDSSFTTLIKYPQKKKNVSDYEVPAEINKISNGAFYGCDALTEIILPKGIKIIEKYAFAKCSSLEYVVIPEGVQTLRGPMFCYSNSMKYIAIPQSVTDIGSSKQSNHMLELVDFDLDVYCYSTDYFSDYEEYIRLDNGVKVTYDANGGSCDIAEQIVYLTKLYENMPVPVRKGYVFLGWYTKKDGGRKITDSSIADRIADHTLYAHWEGGTDIDADYKIGIVSDYDQAGKTVRISGQIYAAADSLDYSSLGALVSSKERVIASFQNGKVTKIESLGQVFRCKATVRENSKPPITLQNSGYVQETQDILVRLEMVSDYPDSAFQGVEDIGLPVSEMTVSVKGEGFCICRMDADRDETTVSLKEAVNRTLSPGSVAEYQYVVYARKGFVYTEKELPYEIAVSAETENGTADGRITLHALFENTKQDINTADAKQELERLKSGDPFSLEKDFQNYLSQEQMDIMESYLYTWLAEASYAYQYSGSSGIKERIMKKSGIDPQGDFASGIEQAITHVCVETKFGIKTFEITIDIGKPDGSRNLYPVYGAMHYEVLEKGGIPSDVPKSGQIGSNSYADMGPFAESVKQASEDSLHSTWQWQQMEDEKAAGVLIDRTVSEIVGNKNGSFSEGTFTIYAQPLFTYSKIVKVSCPVDVYIYSMDGKEAGSIVNNRPSGGSNNVWFDVNGDTKTAYLSGDDYYVNLRGTGSGTMKYQVEEIANKEVCRTVQFLEIQLKEDLEYEGYVFRPLNIDRDMYALRTSAGQEVIYPDKDSYEASFKQIQQLSLSQKNSALESSRTVQLSASHLPLDASNPNLRWTTDNESVAKVDENGLVTAVGKGKAMVTVSTKDGSFLKQFCVIDVSAKSSSSGGSSSGGSGGSSWGGSGAPVEQVPKPSGVKVHYVLQFDLNGGTKTSRKTMTLLSGDIPGIMPKAQRKDYTFSGWYTKQQGGEKINGDKPLDAAATLYARWAKAAAPAKPASLKLASKKKGQIQAGFQNVNGAAGYQLDYSVNKNFTSAKTKEAKASAKTKTLTGLKAGKKYYVRVRAYSLDSMGNRIYGPYSTVKSVTVKK